MATHDREKNLVTLNSRLSVWFEAIFVREKFLFLLQHILFDLEKALKRILFASNFVPFATYFELDFTPKRKRTTTLLEGPLSVACGQKCFHGYNARILNWCFANGLMKDIAANHYPKSSSYFFTENVSTFSQKWLTF